jgi:predicted metal-binding membrane protein
MCETGRSCVRWRSWPGTSRLDRKEAQQRGGWRTMGSLLAGAITTLVVLKILLTYAVSYGVSTFSTLSASLVEETRKKLDGPMREVGMEHGSAFAPTVLERWRRRENLLPGAALVLLATVAWAYTAYQASAMHGMEMSNAGGLALFLLGWAVMMIAMMIPATLPLILLYGVVARQRQGPVLARIGTAALLTGYIGVWTVAGLPVYAYNNLAAADTGPAIAVLPALLLIGGGAYQFTALKSSCHTRCSSPLFFLMQKWRPGTPGALRLGVLHGIDCLGCCAGVMLGLVALGMMNLAWMLTAALIIFAEKTLPDGHRIVRPLGLLMVAGGIALLGFSLLGGTGHEVEMQPGTQMDPEMEMDPEMGSM